MLFNESIIFAREIESISSVASKFIDIFNPVYG